MTRRLSGRSFHKRGAFTEKPRRPKRSRLWCGTASSALLAERSWRPGSYILIKSVMYAGARLWIARNVSTSNLYITRNRIGSQCNAIRTGVMWSRRRCRIIKRHRVTVIQLRCYECMHDGLACIDSQAVSYLGYVV